MKKLLASFIIAIIIVAMFIFVICVFAFASIGQILLLFIVAVVFYITVSIYKGISKNE